MIRTIATPLLRYLRTVTEENEIPKAERLKRDHAFLDERHPQYPRLVQIVEALVEDKTVNWEVRKYAKQFIEGIKFDEECDRKLGFGNPGS